MKPWYLGTIGFSYKDWVGAFYPIGMKAGDYLSYYCRFFNCVEIDSTFHAIPKATQLEAWEKLTPPEFRFCLKTPQVITHERVLQGTRGLMEEFLDATYPLHSKLGPVLIQLPPRFAIRYLSILEEFLSHLPPGFRYAVEFRHPSWFTGITSDLLTQCNVAWVAVDYPHLPNNIIPTTDFIYIRWIGNNGLYRHHSFEREDKTVMLKGWIRSISSLKPGTAPVYGFFNNDYTGFAAGTCQRFKQLAGFNNETDEIPTQQRLF